MLSFAAGRARPRTAAYESPDRTRKGEAAAESLEAALQSPDARANHEDSSMLGDAEGSQREQSADMDRADADQPESSSPAARPTTLLEELLSLPGPNSDSLVASPSEGMHTLHATRINTIAGFLSDG